MKVQFEIIKSKERWEEFISKQKYTSIFQSWNWGDFEREMGNKFKRIGLFRGKKLVALLPIKHIKAARGRYLHLRHGPIFDFEDESIYEVIFEYLQTKAKESNCWFVRISPLIEQSLYSRYEKNFIHFKKSPMHDVDAEITWVLNLAKSESEILNAMRKNTRYYIKRAQRDGVKVKKSDNIQYLDIFWNIYKETFQRQSWHAYPKEYVKKEFEILSGNDQIELYLAEYKGKFIAGSLIVYYQDQAIYHHSGTLKEYLKIPASYLIQWEAIKEARKRGLKWYNFWGISPLVKEGGKLSAQKGHPWEGLTFFKMGFGGQVREFIHAKDLPVSPMYNFTRTFETFEKWKRGY